MPVCRAAPEIWQVNPGEVVAVQDTAYKILFMVEPELRELYAKQFPAIVATDHWSARVTSRLSPQSEQMPYSLMNPPARPAFTPAR